MNCGLRKKKTMNRQKSFENPQGPALFLVPTPIGNLGEISQRMLETLQSADVIACEDTRNSGLLLQRIGIRKPLISHHEHNMDVSIPKIVSLLEEGKKVAVISDAGYPVISDPGSRLVRTVIEKGFPAIPVSGPNAALDALVVSGLDASHFLFYGFLDSKPTKRKTQLEGLKEFPYTIVFYEAPHRIESMLKDVREVFGDRQICLSREITKMYEEHLRGSISEVLSVVDGLKGEMVVVVSGNNDRPKTMTLEEGAQEVIDLAEHTGLKISKACAQVAKRTGLSKNALYDAVLALTQMEESEE